MTKVFNDSELEGEIPPPWVSWAVTAGLCLLTLAVVAFGLWLRS